MSQFNEIKFAPELARAARIFLGMDEDGGLINVSEQIGIGTDLWDNRIHPEISRLRGERLCARAVITGGSDGTHYSWVALRNPAASGIIATLDWWAVCNTTNIRIIAGQIEEVTEQGGGIFGAIASTSGGRARDTRWASVGSICVVDLAVAATATTLVNPHVEVNVAANTFFTHEPQMVLTPGNCYLILDDSVSRAVTASFKWRERRALPGELTA